MPGHHFTISGHFELRGTGSVVGHYYSVHDPSPSSPPPLKTAAVLNSLTLFSCGFSQSRRMHQSVVRFAPFSLSTGSRTASFSTWLRFCRRLLPGSNYSVPPLVPPWLSLFDGLVRSGTTRPPSVPLTSPRVTSLECFRQCSKSPSRISGPLLPNDGTEHSVSLTLPLFPATAAAGSSSIV